RASVGDRQLDGTLEGRQRHADLGPRRGEARRVLEDVREHLVDLDRVDPGLGEVRPDLEPDREWREERADPGHDGLHHVLDPRPPARARRPANAFSGRPSSWESGLDPAGRTAVNAPSSHPPEASGTTVVRPASLPVSPAVAVTGSSSSAPAISIEHPDNSNDST